MSSSSVDLMPVVIVIQLFLSSLSQGGVLGTVRARDTGQPLAYATVEVVDLGLTTTTDTLGRFRFERVPDGRFEVRATAFGYRAQTRRINPNVPEIHLDFLLDPQPIALRPLTARVQRPQEGGAAERFLFEREVVPALVGVSGREVRDVPVLAEPDVLRSLQALPGVTRLNDLSAQLHVQGGAAGQNQILWDGVRIFAPYHMFGMFAALNPDVVGRVNFFRGHFPARYGGTLSAVVDVEPPVETRDTLVAGGGVSLLGGRVMGRGQIHDGAVQWLAAGRVTHTGFLLDRVFEGGVPYAYRDLQARVQTRISPHDQVTASGFLSHDRFQLFFNGPARGTENRWRNGAAKLEWTGQRGQRAFKAAVWTTGFLGAVRVGGASNLSPSENRVQVNGARAVLIQPGEHFGFRLGAEVESGTLRLDGGESVGGFLFGSQRSEWLSGTFFTELETRTGPLRTAPGLRLTREWKAARTLVEPRLSLRYALTEDAAITLGLARTHQYVSSLQDDRFVMPGPPFWFMHPSGSPASRSDNLNLAFDAWRGREWSVHVAGYARSLVDVPAWRPQGTRTLDQVMYESGTSRGASVMLRRHEGRLTGWVGYSYARTRLDHAEYGEEYAPPWDRAHTADAAVFFHMNDRVTISGRAVYGSGQPFWPPIGEIDSQRFSPLEGTIRLGEGYPVWSDRQMRMADYFRLDGSVRGRFNLGRFDLEAFVSMLNLGERENVLYYRLSDRYDASGTPRVVLVPEHVIAFFPSIGFNLWF